MPPHLAAAHLFKTNGQDLPRDQIEEIGRSTGTARPQVGPTTLGEKMKALIVFSLVTLATGSMAHAAECQPPSGASCSRNGSYLACRKETCDPPENNKQRCVVRNILMYEKDGVCKVKYGIAVRTKSIEPPGGSVSGAPDSRCAHLTEAQRAATDSCH